ncbi:MAG: TerB family tellurite resistance protein [Cyclobacteriaceae bacterium]
MVKHGKFQDFILFLYLHMAHADGSMNSQEEAVVREKMTKLFPEETDLNQTFELALAGYRETKKDDIPILIRETFEYFKEVKFSVKYRIYTDMYDIINADGKVEELETSALDLLRKVINLGTPEIPGA